MSDEDPQAGGRGMGMEAAAHRYLRLDTISEIDRLSEELTVCLPADAVVSARQWLAKIRAHAVADELERKRLQGEILRSATSHGERLFTEDTVRRMLDLQPGWQLAPQRARLQAQFMEPHPVCGERFGDTEVTCLRPSGHPGEHCPGEACGVDHDDEEA